MKILHTADWHLGDRLGRIDRTDDLRKAVERVAVYCKQEQVEVLLVAGDLFSELARPEGLRETIHHWQEVFREFLETGGTILTVTGNHDNENFCQTLVHAMSLAAPGVGKVGEVVPRGRLYLAADPALVRLEDRQSGEPVQFVLMPYPTPSQFLMHEPGRRYSSAQEKNRLIADGWSKALADFQTHPKFDPQRQAVLVAHVHAHGSQVGPSLFRLTDEEDIVVAGPTWAESFAYAALGHIHKPQSLGAPHIRYSGSIERMDLGEKADQKGVVLFDLGPKGLRGEPTTLPLSATPIYEIAIRNPAEELPRLKEEYADAKTDLVNIHLTYTAGRDNLETILQELNDLFPRWYARDWHESGELGSSLSPLEAARSKSFSETVREYITAELIQHSEADRDVILALAEEMMKDESRVDSGR